MHFFQEEIHDLKTLERSQKFKTEEESLEYYINLHKCQGGVAFVFEGSTIYKLVKILALTNLILELMKKLNKMEEIIVL